MDELAAELRGRGVEVQHEPADLADADERQRLAAWATEALGPIGHPGQQRRDRVRRAASPRTTEDELEAIVAVNLLAVMDLTRMVLPGMLEREPRPRRQHGLARRQGAARCTWRPTRRPSTAWSASPTRCGPSMERRAGRLLGDLSRLRQQGGHVRAARAPGVPPRSSLGTVPPEPVGDAVVRAIRKNLAEVIVNKGPVGRSSCSTRWRPAGVEAWRAPGPCASSPSGSRGPAIASSGPGRPAARDRPAASGGARAAS